MTNDVVLGSALRTNLLSLQRTQQGIDKIQNILATGLKVSSALDNPQNFFAAQGLNNRASDLTRLLDGIGQSISTIQAADKGSAAVGKLIEQAESITASALEESANGTTLAKVSGDVDLRGITDLTGINGVAATDTLTFVYTDKDGTTVRTANIAIEANDSIEELIGKINDVGEAAATSTTFGQGQVLRASLNEDGGLEIESKTGGSFRLQFEAGGNPNDTIAAADTALGAALGFGDVARNVSSGGPAATAGNFEVTALATATLTSGAFYNAAGDGFAKASDALTTVEDDAGVGRFTSQAATTTLSFSVNGVEEVSITDTTATTIQGLVDTINESTLIKASYDDTTGEFSIEAVDPSVSSIQINVTDTAANAAVVDFDFGNKSDLTLAGAANDANGENYILGVANERLADLEADYNTVLKSIDELVADSGYRGVNLLAGDELKTNFNENRTSSLVTQGRDLSSAGLGLSEGKFSSVANITALQAEILDAKDTVRGFGNAIANSLSIVQTREDFTKDLISDLEAGADKLTVADQNEEGAKLLALQTRQQLGVTSLSLAVQSQQSVLRLF